MSGALTWTLAIATYERPEMLLRCLRLAAAQTRPPSEVVVVDASADWEKTRARVIAELAPRHPGIAWHYHCAQRASAAAQRNECIQYSRGDVLFLVDDDSLLYPDCAEKILEVYELDTRGRIAGVAAALAGRAPDDPGAAAAGPPAPPPAHPRPVAFVRRLLRADDLFVPYDEDFPSHEMPPEVAHLKLGQRRTMAGMTMTVRRRIALQEPFETVLERGSQGEDSDMSYRVSRHGKLVTRFDARLHHVGSPEGRLPSRVAVALGALNPLVLHVLHSTDRERSARRTKALLRRRFVIGLLTDLQDRAFTLPRAAGLRIALREHARIFAMDPREIRSWYALRQRELFEHQS